MALFRLTQDEWEAGLHSAGFRCAWPVPWTSTRPCRYKERVPSSQSTAWQYSLRLLTAGDRSAQELRTRLAGREHSAEEIAETMERLHRAGFLDDQRLANNVAAIAARRGYGSMRARVQLQTRGVDKEHISLAIAAAFADEPELARQLFRKRFPNPPTTPAERGKAARFLAQRGFPHSTVLVIVGEDC